MRIYKLLFAFVLLVALVGFVSAEETQNSTHVNIQVTDSNGNPQTGTFDFEFNISTSSSCDDVLYTKQFSRTTDSRGIISEYLDNLSLAFDQQYYFCYYRDGILKSNNKMSRVPYAFSTDKWDDLDTPADISTSELTDDNTYLRVDGDTATGSFFFDKNVTFGENNVFFWNHLNNRLGLGTNSPSLQYDQVSEITNISQNVWGIRDGNNNTRSLIRAGGTQRWNLASPSGERGSISYSTPQNSPGILFRDAGDNQRSDFRHIQSGQGGFEWLFTEGSEIPNSEGMRLFDANSNTATFLEILGGTGSAGISRDDDQSILSLQGGEALGDSPKILLFGKDRGGLGGNILIDYGDKSAPIASDMALTIRVLDDGLENDIASFDSEGDFSILEGDLFAKQTIITGSNTDSGLGAGDINASNIYYDTINAKSPIISCSDEWCSADLPESKNWYYIKKDSMWNVYNITGKDGKNLNEADLVRDSNGAIIEAIKPEEVNKILNKTKRLHEEALVREDIRECSSKGGNYNGTHCMEIFDKSVTYTEAVNISEVAVMETEEYECSKLNEKKEVVTSNCTRQVETQETKTQYEFNEGCNWDKDKGYYCKSEGVI